MSAGRPLAEVAIAVRDAVAAGELGRARRLWGEYAAALASEPTTGRLQEARHLIDWTRQECAAGQARLSEEISSLRICLRYADTAAPRHGILRVRA